MAYDTNVAAQQTALNKLGANLKVDGILGPLTQAAITKYTPETSSKGVLAPVATPPAPSPVATVKAPDDPENMYNTATGQLNTNYKNYVPPASTSIPAPVATPPAPTTLQQGVGNSTAPDPTVKQVQTQLGITSDGIFGPQTKSAVMAFQEANGLVADGVIGPKTTAALTAAASAANKSNTNTATPSANTTTTKAPDDPGNQFNTATGQPNPNYKAPSSSTPPNPQQEISTINDGANADMEKMLEGFKTSVGTSVDVSDSSKLLSAVEDALSGLSAPVAKSELSTYNDQRAALGVGPLEDSLSTINSQLDKLDSDYKSLSDTEDNRLVSTSQINRRKSAEQITYEKQKADLTNQKNSLVNQLNQKYSVIDNIIKYTGDDAQTAQTNYTNQFNKIITLTNLIKGVQDDQKSTQEKAADNARANATLLVNTLKDKQVDFSKLDASTALDIKNLEIQAGLPSGFIQFAMQASDKPIISMGSEFTDANNNRQVPIYTKDPSTGVISTKVITIGSSSPSTTNNTQAFSDFLKTGIAPNGTKVGAPKGKDGFSDPSVYTAAFNNRTGTTAEFLSKFPVEKNVNPASYNLLPEALKPKSSADNTINPATGLPNWLTQ